MDAEDREEQEEEEMELPTPTSYDAIRNSSRVKMENSGGEESCVGAASGLRRPRRRYRECLKNHAVGIGGHAVDGCGEFMPAGEEGSLDALKCAACSCHRNFHRKETEGAAEGFLHPHHQAYHPHLSPFYRTPYIHMARPLALPSTSGGGAYSRGDDQEDVSNIPSPSGGTAPASRKRFRTKFTQEQKDRMLAFADQVGWRIQRQDEAMVQQFCTDASIKRHVLKVWMHNNKNTLGRKMNPSPSPDQIQYHNPYPNPNPPSPQSDPTS